MSVEDAAKIVISAGMVVPDYEARLKQLADMAVKTEGKRVVLPGATPPPAGAA
jgi:uncharacterized membrane protein